MYSSKYKTLVWNTSWYKPFDRGISKYDVSHNTSDPRKILKAIHNKNWSHPNKIIENLMLVIYFDTIDSLKPISYINVPMAKTDLVITEQTTTIYVPNDYIILETFGAKGGSELPPFKSLLIFVILIGGLAYLLKKQLKFMISYLIFASGVLLFDVRFFWLLIAISLILIIKQ